MGFVFKINEELAAISVTATELLSITRTITNFIKDPAFKQQFNGIIAEINKSYGVVMDSFAPFYELASEEKFTQLFDETFNRFKSRYLMDVSKPRRYCDNVYDAYVKMQQTKEAKTGFPVLRRSFSRLDAFYDKWITNDALLAMSIDGALKLKNRLLTEISEIKNKDSEDAYLVFSSALDDFNDFLSVIQTKADNVNAVVAS